MSTDDRFDWSKWIPNRKVTAGAVSAAIGFVIVWAGVKGGILTPAEGFALGGAVTTIVAYWMPER